MKYLKETFVTGNSGLLTNGVVELWIAPVSQSFHIVMSEIGNDNVIETIYKSPSMEDAQDRYLNASVVAGAQLDEIVFVIASTRRVPEPMQNGM